MRNIIEMSNPASQSQGFWCHLRVRQSYPVLLQFRFSFINLSYQCNCLESATLHWCGVPLNVTSQKRLETALFLPALCHFLTVSPSLRADGPNSSALGSETRPSCDGSPAAELRGGRQHPGHAGNHGPDVRIWEGPHTHRQAAAGEKPVWPHADWQGNTAANIWCKPLSR